MFINLTMLAGLGAALVPLVVHLLARSRYRTVDWGAMMFLQGMDSSQTHSARVRQWVLLGMRMLLVGLLAVALARPVVEGRWGGEGRVTAVIMLDRSYSMAYGEGGRTRFDKAREAVLQILAGFKKGDEVALVLLGGQVEVPFHEPTSNLQMVARDVAELTVTDGDADLAHGLKEARAILDRPDRVNRELYLVCDRQAMNWKALEANPPADFRKWLDDRAMPTRFRVIPVGGEDTEDVAIEAVELADGVAVRSQPAEVEVRVRNYGKAPAAAMELSLYLTTPADGPRKFDDPGRRIGKTAVTVGAKNVAEVRIPVLFDQAGSHVLTAQIKGPGLETDKRFDSAIDVVDPIRVLIISGDEKVEESRRESFFLKLALAPYQTALKRPQGDPAVVVVRPAEEWNRTDLSRFQVIILANVPQITFEQARALEQKVYEGSGLIIAPGNLSIVENYNSALYRNGLGLMPAKLSAPVPADGSKATSVLGLELSHAVFRFRRGTDPLPGAVVGRYFPAVPRPADARVLATYASGEPFLVEGPRGRGKVLLLTTPLDADWSTLPLQPFFLPFVQSAVRYVCSPTNPPRNLAPGEPLIASFDDPVDERTVVLTRNDDPPLPLTLSAGGIQAMFTDTQRPGIYRVQARSRGGGPLRVLHFVVQTPRDESDLSALTGEQWRQEEKLLGFERVELGNEPIGTKLASEREGRELWLYLVLAVMMVGVGELWLARRWQG
jgi:hypothetical protein